MTNWDVLTTRRCDVCRKRPIIMVGTVPGAGTTVGYCRPCKDINAHPWDILVTYTAIMGGLKDMLGWWHTMVDATCVQLGKTREDFTSAVAKAIVEGVSD